MGWVIVVFGMAIPKVGGGQFFIPFVAVCDAFSFIPGVIPTFGMAIPKSTITQPIPTVRTDRVVGTTPEQRLESCRVECLLVAVGTALRYEAFGGWPPQKRYPYRTSYIRTPGPWSIALRSCTGPHTDSQHASGWSWPMGKA